MIPETISALLILLFGALALLHFIWIFRPVGAAAVPTEGGEPLFRPGPVATFLVAMALCLCAALVFLLRHPAPFLPGRVAWIGNAGIAGAFALRAIGDFRYVGFFKSRKGSVFASRDSRFYSPLCVLIAAGEAYLLLAAH